MWILLIMAALAGMLIQYKLKNKFEKYSVIPNSAGMTGAEVATKMLHDNGIFDVKVVSVGGMLTDHYNPATKTVNLSDGVFHERSIVAAAVAAHECGHALQHAKGYAPLSFRSAMVPVVNFASSAVSWVLLAGIILIKAYPNLIWVGIGLFAVTTLFSLITLPVEINASSRALKWLENSDIADGKTKPYATEALKLAAYTYVIAAISSVITLLYYVSVAYGNRK